MKIYNKLFLLLSVIALITAYISQFIFGFIPCRLCIYERIPYFIIIILCIVSLFVKHKVVFVSICLCYIVNALISIYHMGLEYGWFFDVLGCSSNVDLNNLSFDDIKNNLLNTNIAYCNVPSFIFLGISMAGWNFIYSMVCLLSGVCLFSKDT
ncbi:disulfide bond formation protein B [Candidatus Neoehrlichia procyonis]|uniref:Disulfide bond formation DsbB family protein n=1 Tax=Candidatus Neoehrlichia procyonis str. RAC413 TaxID=1359163 RepID=A0A0F3NPG2_9RICK|nr:disulfide bond formation protein B [Candidatus Neoehrlichia lotoris]KJV69631.1 disulfide bond formation DsbB family protein [Candidatus Neoehrlichia lotoris str. RAC413]